MGDVHKYVDLFPHLRSITSTIYFPWAPENKTPISIYSEKAAFWAGMNHFGLQCWSGVGRQAQEISVPEKIRQMTDGGQHTTAPHWTAPMKSKKSISLGRQAHPSTICRSYGADAERRGQIVQATLPKLLVIKCFRNIYRIKGPRFPASPGKNKNPASRWRVTGFCATLDHFRPKLRFERKRSYKKYSRNFATFGCPGNISYCRLHMHFPEVNRNTFLHKKLSGYHNASVWQMRSQPENFFWKKWSVLDDLWREKNTTSLLKCHDYRPNLSVMSPCDNCYHGQAF